MPADSFREQYKRYAVTLDEHKIAQRCGKKRCIIYLADSTFAGKRHTSAAIQQYVNRGIRFLLELLDVQFVATTEHLPVEELQLIAGMIFSMVTVFNTEPVERTWMQA